MTAKTCMTAGCGREAMSHTQAHAKIGKRAILGLCPLHSIRAWVVNGSLTEHYTYTSNPTAIEDWVEKVRASKSLTLRKLTVRDVTLKELADLTGVVVPTLSRLSRGGNSYVQHATADKLMPWVMMVDPSQQNTTLEVGQSYPAAVLNRAPLGTVIVDFRGRAWQYRGMADYPKWCPAHLYRPGNPRSLSTGPTWPSLVVYTPNQVFTRTKF